MEVPSTRRDRRGKFALVDRKLGLTGPLEKLWAGGLRLNEGGLERSYVSRRGGRLESECLFLVISSSETSRSMIVEGGNANKKRAEESCESDFLRPHCA